MSGESALHVRLVERLISTIEAQHGTRLNMMILADHHRYGHDRPPQIGGYTPDLYASNVPTTFRIIGEAKTASDLKSDRSQMQIEAFLDHLALYSQSEFYLVVPWPVVARARNLVKSLRRPAPSVVATKIIQFP